MGFFLDIENKLKKREEEGLLRVLRPLSGIDFSSNDYLGLAQHPKIISEINAAADKYGSASSASRLMSGDLELHHQLEEKVAKFKNKEAALVFNSGYQANVGIISSLYAKDDCIFSDRLNHASIIDGIILSGARFFRFKHNDVEHLELLLKNQRHKFNNALIVTETVFSMDGDRPRLKESVNLKEKYNCQIMVDEAHATGIFGKNGSGVAEEEGLSKQIDFIMGTFSKALAGFGAYLATSKKIVEYLINTCRSFIYSTALPPAVIAGNIASLGLIKEEPQRRRALLDLAGYFRAKLKSKGLNVLGSTQIIPLVIGGNQQTKEIAKRLQEKGYWALPVRPPTVPQGQARLRFSVTCRHNREILDKLADEIFCLGI